jgi:tetratricopeptide (TPR) repeat protein
MHKFFNSRTVTLLCLASWLWAPCAFSSNEGQVIDLNNSGVKLINAESYDLAIQAFQQALALDPGYTIAHDNLVITYNRKGAKMEHNPVEALRQFHKALLLDPYCSTTVGNLQALLPKLGLKPNDYRDRFGLAAIELREGDYAGALAEYWEAMRLQDLVWPAEKNGSSPFHQFHLLSSSNKQPDVGIPLDAVEQEDANASQFERTGSLVESLRVYKQLLQMRTEKYGASDEDTIATYGDIARVLSEQGQVSEATDQYEQAIAAFKKSCPTSTLYERLLENYGDMLNQTGQTQKATSIYAEAQTLFNKNHKQ